MLVDSGISNRCCLSCPADGGGTDDGHRRLQDLFPSAMIDFLGQAACPVPAFADRVASVSETCCTSAISCNGETIPLQCSFDCARAFTTFLADCGHILQTILGTEVFPKCELPRNTHYIDVDNRV